MSDVADSGGKIDREWDDRNNIPYEFSCFIPYNLVSQHSIPGNVSIWFRFLLLFIKLVYAQINQLPIVLKP